MLPSSKNVKTASALQKILTGKVQDGLEGQGMVHNRPWAENQSFCVQNMALELS